MDCHRICPGIPAAVLIVDRGVIAAVHTFLVAREVAEIRLGLGATSPRLSAIVLGPLMIDVVERDVSVFLARQGAIVFYSL